MSVAPSLPFSPMTSPAGTAEAGLQSFGLAQSLGQDCTVVGNTLVVGNFGTLLDGGAGQPAGRQPGLQGSGVIPSGIPLTAGCVAQVAALAQPVVTTEATRPIVQALVGDTALPQEAAQQAAVAALPQGTPTSKPSQPQQTAARNSLPGAQVAACLSQSSGQGSVAANAGVDGQDSTDNVEDEDEDETSLDLGKGSSESSASSDQTQVLLTASELLGLAQPPLALQPTPPAETELSADASATQPATRPTGFQGLSFGQGGLQNWVSLRQTERNPGQAGEGGGNATLPAPSIQVSNTLSQGDALGQASQGAGLSGPVVRSAKALIAYETGGAQDAGQSSGTSSGQDSAAAASQLPSAGVAQAAVRPGSPAIAAATAQTLTARSAPKTLPQAPAPAPSVAAAQASAQAVAQASPQATPVVRATTESVVQASTRTDSAGATAAPATPSFSMESSTNPTAAAKDGDAKDGTPAVLRAGDSTRISQQANSAASAAAPSQSAVASGEKKPQAVEGVKDDGSSKTDGIRNAKSDASMSINRRNRTTDTRSEELPAAAASSVPVTRSETVQAASKGGAAESAQRAVATISELVDRMQARPATKVAIDVPLSGDQNVSVKLEYKAGVLHVNFRTDSTELRDALSREWSTVAAQSDSALRYAEPSFNSSSQDHSQQQSKADAFDLSWGRQEQQQQQRSQQQEEAPRSFSLPGSRTGTASSATDGVSNRDRTTASRQVAPDTTRHLNVVA